MAKACVRSLVDNGTVESRRYYLARRTVIEMLRDRGYVVANMEAELRRTLADFRAAFGHQPEAERLRLIASRAFDPSRKIVAIFCEAFQIKKQNIIGILSQIEDREMLDRVILILQSKMNCHAQNVLDAYPVKVETFLITDLLVNITKHFLEPKHEIMTPEEKNALLKKLNIQDKQLMAEKLEPLASFSKLSQMMFDYYSKFELPMMQENDAIARYYGLEKGQVVRVSYSGGITDYMVTYRCVV